ncbi:hypothetical protein CONPUDRAFT_145910 [Coniophora puteana RWD-64-598 SS2]|uniref:DUF6533 domain-containing protein n=1 Tax=Coniophora puteana (strain RWD-64-598) TaxID=741705 RepID=A0A5M3MGC3_CONPW|nr:uncharacterized protein CONPUDRAFT_145910 [Coniophora puteana RWD-64-598 SS2]EIW77651.1 hypothetical protein CONPUDRAFT_145910 [Coniophora puteana RWD-64-598 SS2]
MPDRSMVINLLNQVLLLLKDATATCEIQVQSAQLFKWRDVSVSPSGIIQLEFSEMAIVVNDPGEIPWLLSNQISYYLWNTIPLPVSVIPTLLVYDYILCLDHEVELIWRHKLSWMSFAYTFLRYTGMIWAVSPIFTRGSMFQTKLTWLADRRKQLCTYKTILTTNVLSDITLEKYSCNALEIIMENLLNNAAVLVLQVVMEVQRVQEANLFFGDKQYSWLASSAQLPILPRTFLEAFALSNLYTFSTQLAPCLMGPWLILSLRKCHREKVRQESNNGGAIISSVAFAGQPTTMDESEGAGDRGSKKSLDWGKLG